MEIKKQYGDFTKQEIFNLSQGTGELLKNQPDGLILDIDRLVILTDTKEIRGEVKEKDIMHIITTEGTIYSTESPTVQSTILQAIDFMETHNLKFSLFRSESKSGRVFMNVSLI